MIRVGDRFVTAVAYGGGPLRWSPCEYEATYVSEPCTCTHIVDRINGCDDPMPPHYHISAGDACWSYLQDFNGRIVGPATELKITRLNPQQDLFGG